MGAAEFSGVLIGTKSSLVFSFRSIGCQFEHCAAHRKPPFSALCCRKQQQKTRSAQQYTSNLLIPCVDGKLNIKHHRTIPKPEIPYSYEYHSREGWSCSGQRIEHQNVHRRRSSSSANTYIRVFTSEADFHKLGMHGGSVRVRANAWEVFGRTPCRGGRGRRAAVYLFRGVFF